MFCTRCGADVPSTGAFCTACGAPTGAGIDPGAPIKRPGLITLLAVLQFIAAGLMGPFGILMFAISLYEQPTDAVAVFLGLLFLGLGALHLVTGIGLWKLKPFGRVLQIVLACIGLLAIPIGTIISALILYFLFRPGIRVVFSGKPPAEYTPAERVEIAAVTQGSQAVVVVVVILVALGAVAMIGIVAAIAIPGLLRARMAGNEAVAIGSMRQVVSAQVAYFSVSGGYATRLATLSVACQGTAQAFISPDLAQDPSVKNGFTITLDTAGATAGPADCNGTPTEMDYYATAAPLQPGTTGQRAFSTSAAGTIFVDPSGAPPSRDATLTATAMELR